MENVRHLFFDLDHTLWDFEANAEDSLRHIIEHHILPQYGHVEPEKFLTSYKSHNKRLWKLYEKGDITQAELRLSRFSLALEEVSVNDLTLARHLGEAFLEQLPTRTKLIKGAWDALEALQPFYTLHLITNGFHEVQLKKVTQSGMGHFFQEVVSSDAAGAMKPSEAIFQYAQSRTGSRSEQACIIGDNLEADIVGGKNAGWKTVWFNPNGAEPSVVPDSTIACLSELPNLFGRA
jgi:putative hydrolase of the HAD superfamily